MSSGETLRVEDLFFLMDSNATAILLENEGADARPGRTHQDRPFRGTPRLPERLLWRQHAASIGVS
jgi:hypothetical protein